MLFRNKVKVIFKRTSGEVIEVEAKVGDTLLDVVVNNNVDIDGFGEYQNPFHSTEWMYQNPFHSTN